VALSVLPFFRLLLCLEDNSEMNWTRQNFIELFLKRNDPVLSAT
jgi:hypothetical protein